MPAPAPNPDLSHEQALWDRGFHFVCGVDEVGRGPLAGPVVAAAVILRSHQVIDGLHDSKLLAGKKREALEPVIREHAWVGVGMADVAEIDLLNIRRAALLAMARAVALLPQQADHLLVDGRDLPPDVSCPGLAIIGGDRRCVSIAAASVIAKVTRDRLMARLAEQYPGYGWEHNSGYPTGEHIKALEVLGITPLHRRTFGPVRRYL